MQPLISPAIHCASASCVSAKWQTTFSPEGFVGSRFFLMRWPFFAISEFAAARISGVER